jgi:hypothetical protein
MRPVISMIGTAEYQLAKYLDGFIKPNINVEYSVDSTASFMSAIQEFKFSEGDELLSFDVCSLFTNVPLDETINLISDLVYSEDSKCVPPFPKKWFKKLLQYATSGMFMYKDQLYKQVDGVAMGSPLGPSLANFFLGHLEKYNFFTNLDIIPKLYVRYVDDIFAVFDKNIPYEKFLEHINNQHPNIKFTVEKSINNVLPFLNTEIKLTGDNFESSVFRKDTNTNVLLNVNAVCPMSWRKGLVYGALNRAKTICSSKELFLKEVDKLKLIFWKNGYSNSFFNKMLESYNNREDKDGTNGKEEKEMRYVIKIPYVGTASHSFKNKLKQLFYDHLRIEISPVFTTFKVSDYFSLKSQTPKLLTSNVVYKFTCLCDTNLTYIGKTKRHLMTRCREHLGLDKSEISAHFKNCDICVNSSFDQFSILKKCKTDHETKINEAIFIKTEIPRLNKNLFNSGSLYTLQVYQ